MSRSSRLTLVAVFFLFVGCGGATSGTSGSTGVTLNSISITPSSTTLYVGGTKQFTAIGTYSDGTTADLTSKASWNTSNTSIATASSTGIMTAVAAGASNVIAVYASVVSNVATSSAITPFAEGDSQASFNTGFLPLAYTGNVAGTAWTLLPAFTQPNGKPLGALNKITCVDANCVAVGLSFDNPPANYLPLAYTSSDGGSTWTLLPAFTLPAGQTQAELDNIACVGTVCTIVGQSYDVSLLNQSPLAYTSTNSGATWTLSPALTLPQAQGFISDVSCVGTTCTAVGSSFAGDDHTFSLGLAYTSTDSGSTWTLSSSLTPPGGQAQVRVVSVSCDGSNCVAVGSAFNTNYTTDAVPVAYTSTNSGSTWTLSTTLSVPHTTGQLYHVTCKDGHCVTVGASPDVTTNNLPVAYTSTDSGSTWTAVTTFTLPSGQTQGILEGVSCLEAVCIAYGRSSIDETSNELPLAYTSTDSGSTWTLVPAFPQPTGQPQGELFE